MLDISNIPGQSNNVWIYYAQGTSTWQTWTKPRKCNFIWMMCIGGGSGGVGGQATGSNSLAGGGGGSGGVVRALFSANVLPDILYVQPGNGGAGGLGATTIAGAFGTSGAGNRSFVSITPSSATVLNIVCTSGAAAAGAVSGQTGGTGETIATATNAGLLSLGFFTAVAGQAGATNTNGAGISITPLSSTITCGGASAGSVSSLSRPGGNINSTIISPGISGGSGNATTTAEGNGGNGIVSWKPLYFLGGAGGSSVDSSVIINGGKGGDGAYGCGGGGGGTSLTAYGGDGGKGGDGLVIIATF